ncbi:S8 family serine peptidase [Micromonospora sp. NPDC005305]|uniref:S8 family serine peptidase n=1 Tax=Micromonospora sp. NPDC005305 TaxID=3156875 RepID=UPI0033B5561D
MLRRNKLAGGVAVLLAAAFGLLPTVAHSAETPRLVARQDSGAPSASVTLVTGDRARLWTVGGRSRVTVEPAVPAAVNQFQQFQRHGDQYVVPVEAAKLVQDGVLDLELFNVTGLVRQGYDDAHTADVPLLVRYADAKSVRAKAPAGAAVRRALPGLNVLALDGRKATTAQLWAKTLTATGAPTGKVGAAPTRAGNRRLGDGIQRVWLNGKVRASLDESVKQIGAPAAWSRSLTGKGVTVAVLDTGIDATHPDFANRVAAARDFTGKGNVTDGNGHGTHVASTVAGSGAASGGRYKGVAFDATLAVGKVLDDTGSGSFDGILAGMQWAATESGAKVVNMSLGGGPSDGTDPVSVAVNDLTRQYGTLFVVAAGNDGADEAVGTPAAADDALAVASVSKSDVLSPFSNRGPRLGDGALKPEVAAPGEGIVAARASGVDPIGEPVGEAYQRLTGTSMATPHVAGGAALLVQQHPDWSSARLKSALMSTAAQVDASPHAVGTGRVDVDRATGQPVTATGGVSVNLPWPNVGTVKRSTVTWSNTGTSAVTLALSGTLTRRDGQAPPAGMLALSADTVTVPAGGDASIDVLITGKDGGAAGYAGMLTGASADGAVRTRTALSVLQEEEKFDLKVNLVDRDGRRAAENPYRHLWLVDLDHGQRSQDLEPGGTVRVPRGRYSLHGSIATARPGGEPSVSLISHPEFTLDHDASYTLDARIGQPASASTDNPAARGGKHEISAVSRVSDCSCPYSYFAEVDPRFVETYVATVPGTDSSAYAFTQARTAREPELEVAVRANPAFALPVGWFGNSPPAEQGSIVAVYGGAGTPEDLAKIDANGKLVVFEATKNTGWDQIFQRIAAIKDAGGKYAMWVGTDPAGASAAGGGQAPGGPALPTMVGDGATSPTMQRFVALVKAAGTPVSYVFRPWPALRYELAYLTERKVSEPQVHQAKTAGLVAVRARYHDNSADSRHVVQAFAVYDDLMVGVGSFEPVRAGQERTEYFTPGTWNLNHQVATFDGTSQTVSLRAGYRATVTWNKAVAGPSWQLTSTDPHSGQGVWRDRRLLVAMPPMFSDPAGRPRVPWSGLATGSITLYRDGQQVGTEPDPGFALFPLPDDAASYRLVAEATVAPGSATLSTKVSAAWTFRSSVADEGKPVPLLTVRFDPAVDLRNRAPAGKFSFPAYVSQQGGGATRATSFTVDVSYDDGKTWRPTLVTADGDHYQVTTQNPVTGYATLRAKATDANGNTVEQTVLRGYAIGR